MAQESEKTLQLFETRTRQLILAYKELESRYAELQEMLRQKEETIKALEAQKSDIEKNYADLKLARMIDINDTELHDAKSRIGKLIREVDKCIALLNV